MRLETALKAQSRRISSALFFRKTVLQQPHIYKGFFGITYILRSLIIKIWLFLFHTGKIHGGISPFQFFHIILRAFIRAAAPADYIIAPVPFKKRDKEKLKTCAVLHQLRAGIFSACADDIIKGAQYLISFPNTAYEKEHTGPPLNNICFQAYSSYRILSCVSMLLEFGFFAGFFLYYFIKSYKYYCKNQVNFL